MEATLRYAWEVVHSTVLTPQVVGFATWMFRLWVAVEVLFYFYLRWGTASSPIYSRTTPNDSDQPRHIPAGSMTWPSCISSAWQVHRPAQAAAADHAGAGDALGLGAVPPHDRHRRLHQSTYGL